MEATISARCQSWPTGFLGLAIAECFVDIGRIVMPDLACGQAFLGTNDAELGFRGVLVVALVVAFKRWFQVNQ